MALKQTTGKKFIDGAGGTSATIANAFPANIAAGSTLILALSNWRGDESYRITGVTIGGQAATLDARAYEPTTFNSAELWRVQSHPGGSNRDIVVTFAAAGGYVTCCADEWDQFDASPVDKTATAAVYSDTGPSTATVTTDATTQAAELIYSVFTQGGTSQAISTPAGYTSTFAEPDNENHVAGAGAYKAVGATGAQTASWGSIPAYGSWGVAVVAYKTMANGGSSGGPFDLAPSAAIAMSGALSVAGDTQYAQPVVFDVAATAAIGLQGALAANGDLQSFVSVPFEVEQPIEVPTLAGSLLLSGDLQYVVPGPAPFDLVASGPLALTGALGAAGALQIVAPVPFDLAPTAAIGLAATLGVAGDINLARRIDLVQQGAIGIAGYLRPKLLPSPAPVAPPAFGIESRPGGGNGCAIVRRRRRGTKR